MVEGKYRSLQPYVIATLMVIMSFFAVLMLFAANPFETSFAGARLDGEGLNPLLRNFYMIIHPPSLYMGFVGCSVPFAFAIAALATGRLDNEWIAATRKWMLFAWLFLSIGNCLGMLWAYEELGWGGYWAWDPVENAACLPWFTATAYVHSTMIQERRNMLKVWNLVLICTTFFLTIFGTFLTRAGLIASVHAFAKSDIGIYFVYFMALIIAVPAGLIVWRLPLLRSRGRIESVVSREGAFVVNNWVLLGACTFIGVATIFPRISEWLWDETVTVGPPFFNRWMVPIGLSLLALMGVAPLLAWRKSSTANLAAAARFPLISATVAAVLHLSLGSRFGFPGVVPNDAFYDGVLGIVLQQLGAVAPVVTVGLVAFNFAVVGQEFYRGAVARRRQHAEPWGSALLRLVQKSRRRYGGYIVHIGISLMFLGFAGRAWTLETEANMSPGDKIEIGDYSLTYAGPRMELDAEKRMVFADVDVSQDGVAVGRISPARFIYKSSRSSPTTEVALHRTLKNDLYAVVAIVNPTTKRATFRFHVNPLVSWLWIGVSILICGCLLSLWPEVSLQEMGVWATVRMTAGVLSGVMFGILLASMAAGSGAARGADPPPRAPLAAVVAQ